MNQTLIITHAVLVGLTPLIPVPLLDDLVKSFIYRRLVELLAFRYKLTLSASEVSILAEAFFDPFVCYLDEQIVGSELRERLVGLTTTWLLLLVVYVIRGDIIRIVSARMVTKAERELYENK